MVNKSDQNYLLELRRLTQYAKTYLSNMEVGETFILGETASYIEAGRGGDVVLLIHGFSCDKSHWRMLMSSLESEYRVIAIDIPGFTVRGHMNDPDKLTIDFLLSFIREFCDWIGIDNFHLIGSSAGSVIGGLFSIRHPEMVRSVTMLGTPPLIEDPEGIPSDPVEAANFYMPDTVEGLDRILQFLYRHPPILPKRTKAWFVECGKLSRDYRIKVVSEFLEGSKKLIPELAKIETPTLFVHGEYDRVTPKSRVDEMVSQLPNFQHYMIPNTGHMSNFESPDEVAKVFNSFVKYASDVNQSTQDHTAEYQISNSY